MLYNTNCDLCNLVKKTKWYYECGTFVILDCVVCKIPMAVSREHIPPTASDLVVNQIRLNMRTKLEQIAEKFYNDKPFYIDKIQRKIPDHLHWHARLLTDAS